MVDVLLTMNEAAREQRAVQVLLYRVTNALAVE